jgi:acyl-CoA dehydrogenase
MSPTSVDPGEVAARTRSFIRDVVVPIERGRRGVLHDADEGLRLSMQAAAREAGVFAPQVEQRWGGLGLDRRAQAVVLEEAGYSLFGPLALNCAAPDEGNIHLLSVVATDGQKARYLQPLAAGRIRSCFAMTEPAPGAGADPRALCTTAVRATSGGWVIDGRKWFTTGAVGAGFVICMARTSGAPGDRDGATMFLVDADNPGLRIDRTVETLDEGMIGGHAEVVFDRCLVPDEAVLGDVDRGFEHAQVRLAPARLTHCMRWTGIAQRAHEIAMRRAREREAFGGPLAELGMVQQMVADSVIDLTASRALIREAAEALDLDRPSAQITSITKTFISEAVGRVVDRSVQICGALGVSGDELLSRFYREVRPFRIYDGPSETHRWAIARRALKAEPT